MTDIVVGVRLNADGSGLVGQLKLSRAEMEQLRTAETGAAEAARDLSRATDDAGKAQARNAAATKQASAASNELTRNVGLQRAGWQQVGFQVQDVFASYASGSRLSVIFAQQSGQLASAIALIAQSAEGGKGKLAGLASFLGGPWGIALGIAVSAGSALAASLLDTGKAADAAKAGASGLSDAQSVLGEIFDLTSGKIKAQNDLLVANARLMAITLRSEAIAQRASSAKTFGDSGDMGFVQRGRGLLSTLLPDGIGSAVSGDYYGARERQQQLHALEAERARISAIKDQSARNDAITKFMARVEKTDFTGLKVDRNQYLQAFVDVLSATQKDRVAKEIDKSLDTGALSGDLRREDKRKPKQDTSAEKAAREVKQLADFSGRAAEAVARLSGEFDTAPRDIDRAAQATRSIDALVKDINERLSTSKNLTAAQRAEFVKIKDDAEKLKPVIQASLIRPFTDMLEVQQRQIELGKLQVAGRQADAEALQLTYSLMDKMGVETEDQLATELAKRGVTEDQVRALYDNLEVMRQQTREMRVQQQVQQMFLGAVSDMRENVRLTLQDLRQDGPKALGDFAKRSLDVFDRLFSEMAVEKLFGGLFRDLEDQLTGGDKVSKAGDKLASAVGRASKEMDSASSDILKLGKAAATAAGQIGGSTVPSASNPVAAFAPTKSEEPSEAEILVTAIRKNFRNGFEGVFADLGKGLKTIFTEIFGDRGLFNASLAKTLGQLAGYGGIGGAAGGLATGLLGIQGSGTGGMIGGALGGKLGEKFLTKGLESITKGLGDFAGPLGSIAGGILGSAIGGVLKKTKTGAANITSVDGEATLSGNSSAFKKNAGGAASNVQDGLSRIAEMFDASIGAFNVTIGQRHGDWRVREGTGSLKIKKGATEFDDDQAGAIAYAIQLAVSQGAVKGLSAAMDKALRSSPDIDKAIAEALKVQEVEQMLGGLGSQLASQFKAFETQAKDRVRIATQYGFDVAAIEKKNAEDRVKLVDQILTDRVGSLQSLLNDMKFGDLAEGSAVDRRNALLAQIATARADAEAGKDGAADKLAAYLRQLLDLTEDAFGTAGKELASDRDLAKTAGEAVIKAENDRIKAAQNASMESAAALATANDIAKEQTTLIGKTNSILDSILSAIGGTGGRPPVDTALVARGL